MATASIPIEIRGRYFWRGSERFLLRGVVYQDYSLDFYHKPHRPPGDEISDVRLEQLEHDIGLFKELGINAIFVFSIDNTACHDKAMEMLEEAGIYVLATVSTPINSINRLDPYPSYTAENLSHYFKTADMLAAYPNCLGVLAGNEVVNDSNTVRAVPVIRAVVRDLKRYLRLKHEVTGQRVLPVGYSAADVRDLEDFTRDYLSAGDEASRLDFWSKNDYSWASPANMQISGYSNQVEHNSHLHIPAFFSEYGANTNSPRDFGETAAMLSPEMTHIFSGGFVYEFWRSGNGFGLVKRPTGQEAAKWRGVHNSFQTALAEGASKKTANMTLGQYANTEGGGGLKFEDPPGTPRRLDRNIAEYRETSIGEIILYRDFLNLKERLAAAKDIEMNTDPDWVDSGITATRAPAFPSDRRFRAVGGEENVPETCVDWARVEESIRDDEYVLVGEN